ncbi:MAG: hypothetical protein A3D35_00805 [Candidatus Staskawiczbacteria bacterium RIFCSPHIGHO2_02_FULL_34_9]|uniref:AB hydrolase-1 domain-containing protein n=1 Tax=Candidatus Staskawiczbacteria bacterium RIFCSPHIGHO2_02_FULL_34_9 TaxID=1802206 RepID=A0A1G2HXW4_9BACT|nr:MAG: hypothetical protein A3D35_00805 [Candidatus Staskawiczbacteria bacterium RIFCSPHIGHO2_02_FULL_34_9]
MEEKQIIVKNLSINYKVFGQGKPFLILHGWGSNSDRWIKVAELLAKNGLLVLVPDLPGFGKSQEPNKAWSIDDYVDLVVEFLKNFTEFKEEFYLLGHSFGGAVSVKLSINHSQRIKKLFLAAAACIRKKTTAKSYLHKISKIIKVFSFLPLYKQLRKAIYKFIIKKSDYSFVEGVMKETYVKVILEDLSQKLLFVKVPTVIIWGDQDELTPVEYSHIINQKIEKSKLIILPNIKHNLDRHDHPEVLTDKILNNLSVEVFSPNDINL